MCGLVVSSMEQWLCLFVCYYGSLVTWVGGFGGKLVMGGVDWCFGCSAGMFIWWFFIFVTRG